MWNGAVGGLAPCRRPSPPPADVYPSRRRAPDVRQGDPAVPHRSARARRAHRRIEPDRPCRGHRVDLRRHRQPRAGRHAQGATGHHVRRAGARRGQAAAGVQEGSAGRPAVRVRAEWFPGDRGGQPVTPTLQTEQDRFTVVTFPTNGQTAVSLEYSVVGAVIATPEGTALEWPLLQGLDSAVSEFSATVAIPGRSPSSSATPAHRTPRCRASTPRRAPTTPSSPPSGTVRAVRASSSRSTSASRPAAWPATSGSRRSGPWPGRSPPVRCRSLWLSGLLILGAAALFALHRRAGGTRAPAPRSTRAAEFVPVGAGQSEFRVLGDVRPGHVGTVADERVDPIDISATLIDLAVHGHLRITELPRESEFAATDWSLARPDSPTDRPAPVRGRAAGRCGRASDEVEVSELPVRMNETSARCSTSSTTRSRPSVGSRGRPTPPATAGPRPRSVP